MKRVLAGAVAAVVVSALASAQARPQIQRDKKAPGDVATPTRSRTAGESVPLPTKAGKKELMRKLTIRRFDAGRDGPKVNIIGVIYNAGPQDVAFSYKISKWTGANWALLAEGGTRFIQAKASMNVTEKIPATNDALRLKLEINGHATYVDHESTSQEFKLAAKKTAFVVRYMTKNGGWALVFDETADVGADVPSRETAQRRAGACQKLGFETKIPVTKNVSVDPSKKSTYRVRVYARAGRELQRTFGTEQEAKDFRGEITSLDRVSRGALFDVRISEE